MRPAPAVSGPPFQPQGVMDRRPYRDVAHGASIEGVHDARCLPPQAPAPTAARRERRFPVLVSRGGVS